MDTQTLAKWLAGHRQVAKVLAVVDGREVPISLKTGAHRWTYAAKLILEANAESVRLYDGLNRLTGSVDLEPPEPPTLERGEGHEGAHAPIAGAHTIPFSVEAMKSSADVAKIVAAVAEACTRVAKDVAKAQADAHREAFQRLAQVAQIATERLVAVEQLQQDTFEARAEELEAKAEAVKQESALDSMFKPLFEKLGEEGVKKLLASDVVKGLLKTEGGAAQGGANGSSK